MKNPHKERGKMFIMLAVYLTNGKNFVKIEKEDREDVADERKKSA